MMKLVWTKELSAGNAVIDSDHKNLIAVVNGIERAIRARDYSVISQAFELLEGWLCVHFANEDKIARATKFDFSKHKHAQQYSLRELQYFKDELVAKKGILCEGAIEHYALFLRDWMTEHITKVDMPMKPMLQALDYKFWPGCRKGEANYAAGHVASLYLQLSTHQCHTPPRLMDSAMPEFS
jgi:hemerythrin-like metal-binding protein